MGCGQNPLIGDLPARTRSQAAHPGAFALRRTQRIPILAQQKRRGEQRRAAVGTGGPATGTKQSPERFFAQAEFAAWRQIPNAPSAARATFLRGLGVVKSRCISRVGGAHHSRV